MPPATLWLIFTTAFIIGLSGAVMPGPLLAVTINQSLRRGFWTGPLIVLGHAVLELAMVGLLVAGLSELMQSNLVSAIIGLVGGGVLLWMGAVTLVRVRQGVALPIATTAGAPGATRAVILSGIVVSLSNPYWFIWWVTLGTVYLLWSLNLGPAGVATFFSGHILADLTWYSLIAFLTATGRKFMNDSIYRVLLGVCGVALIGLGIYFILSGADFIVS